MKILKETLILARCHYSDELYDNSSRTNMTAHMYMGRFRNHVYHVTLPCSTEVTIESRKCELTPDGFVDEFFEYRPLTNLRIPLHTFEEGPLPERYHRPALDASAAAVGRTPWLDEVYRCEGLGMQIRHSAGTVHSQDSAGTLSPDNMIRALRAALFESFGFDQEHNDE